MTITRQILIGAAGAVLAALVIRWLDQREATR